MTDIAANTAPLESTETKKPHRQTIDYADDQLRPTSKSGEDDSDPDAAAILSDTDPGGLQQATTAANGSALASAKLSNKKKEALSQVPCKFFRSNGCSAGNACPFAHIAPGEGQGKAICQWFLKGNCRFGHRCALAHILPGQPMSMDRKNKRAAQHQQQTGGGGSGVNGHILQQGQISTEPSRRTSRQQPRSSDLLHHSNISITGPEVGSSGWNFVGSGASNGMYGSGRGSEAVGAGGGDFMFGLPDDLQQQQPIVGLAQQSPHRRPEWHQRVSASNSSAARLSQPDGSAFDGTIPVGGATSSGAHAFGSPAPAQAFGTSPFSHPGSHSVFYSGPSTEYVEADRALERQSNEDETLKAAAQRSWQAEGRTGGGDDAHAEDFLPSSLSDLFTPAELERRNRINPMSKYKTHLNTPSAKLGPGGSISSSHSMPARGDTDGLLDSDLYRATRNAQASQAHWPTNASGGDAMSKLSSSIQPSSGGQFGDDESASFSRSAAVFGPSRYGASNSSAGFLTSRLQGDLTRTRDAWGNELGRDGASTTAGGVADERLDAYSPGIQAALMHAPGMSLPQGLAVGLSRLHLRSDNDGSTGGGAVNAARSRFTGAATSAEVSTLSSSSTQVPFSGGLHAALSPPGVIGGTRVGHDELGPVVPSSMFAHRSTPLHLQHQQYHQSLGRSVGHGSVSTSFDAGNGSLSSLSQAAAVGNGSPYNRSPALRPVEGGIAIPNATNTGGSTSMGNNSGAVGDKTSRVAHRSINGVPSTTKHSGQHPGMHRLRTGVSTGTGIGASPLALPATGEEVEEAIFELE